MKIIKAPANGFCSGVKQAVKLAEKAAGENVYMYGEIVHNANVIDSLCKKGIRICNDCKELKSGDTLIICAHGAPKILYDYASENGIKIIDATCKFVRKIQLKAAEKFKENYQIVIFGEKNHAEIVGVNGWCGNSAVILDGNSPYDLSSHEKTLVIFQTTFPVEKMDSALEKLAKDDTKTLEIFNTICYTTLERQKFASEISKQCDSILVIGGKNSSNTRRLFEICKENCQNTLLVSEPDELKYFDFSKTRSLGIIAGASTPDGLIEEVLSVVDKQTNDGKENINKTDSELFIHAVDRLQEKRKTLRKGQKLKGIIQHIDSSGVTVSFDFSKKEGFIPNEEMALDGDYQSVKAALSIGDKIEVIVLYADKELILSKKQVDELYKDDNLVEGIKAGKEFSVVAQKEVKGGLLSKLGSYTVFVPSSQIRSGFARNLAQYVGKSLRLVALPDGVDEHKKKIVASQRILLEAEKKDWEDNFWGNIEAGEIVEGTVVRFAPFGAFVSVRGFDCLAHLSDLSWSPVKEPGEVLELNKKYEFVVLKTDRDANRISIGYKQLQPDPWQLAFEKHNVGSVTQGKVVRILPFGAFVEIEPGIDGLLHVSNVTWDWVDDIKKVIKLNEVIDVQILEFIPEQKRLTLSRKATMEQPAETVRKIQNKNEME